MTATAANTPPYRSILDLPDEIGGDLSAAPGAHQPRREAVSDPQVLQAVRDALLAAFDRDGRRTHLDPFAPPVERNSRVIDALRAAVAADRRTGGPLAAVPDDAETLLELFAATLGWGPAQRYLDDPLVNEVKINNCTILVQEAGRPFVAVPERFSSSAEVRSRAVQLASALGVQLDAAHPQETLPVAHGTRVHVSIHPRIAEPDGVLVCIRRGRREAWGVEDLLARGTVDQPVANILRLLCHARCSFLIAGRTGTGKTAMLEALANSWPDTPHIITIEDHTLEIGIRARAAWTRELVDTQRDPQAFGRAAREALRQTPGLLLPGETRGSEAGAILALALSGHAVITTLHARTAAETVARFAGYAAQPGAYMYEGRRDDALRDTCAAFDVVLRLDVLEAIGRRLVAELALLDGAAANAGELVPVLLPLATATVGGDGQVAWQTYASVEQGDLVWHDGVARTPAQLRERLAQARAQEQVRTVSTLATVQGALERGERLVASGETERALSVLRLPWRERRDGRLLELARRAVERTPDRFSALKAEAQAQWAALEALLADNRWAEARSRLNELMQDLATVAAAAPPTDWAAVEERIEAGLAHERAALQACEDANAALRRNDPRAALDLVNGAVPNESWLSPTTALTLLRLREQALEALLAYGEGTAETIRAVRERRIALAHTSGVSDGAAHG